MDEGIGTWLIGALREGALVTLVAVVVGLAVNAVRSDGIDLVARKEYEVVVPCPEPVGDATAIDPKDSRVRASNSLVIDARSADEYRDWHLPGALSLPFDWLGPPPDEQVKLVAERVARSRAQQVIVYGDGEDPDSGREWARLLAGARLRNVCYVVGGGPALGASHQGTQP
jgi:hypothetical protein